MARKRGGGDHSAAHVDERWVVPYADMLTLLLAVFVMLYALSTIDLRKFTALAQSLSTAFSTDVMVGTEMTTISSGVEVAPDVGTMDAGSGAVASDYSTIRASLADFAISQGIDDRVEVTQSDEGIVIRIGGSLLFESGRAKLDDSSVQLLGRIVSLVRPLPNRIRIEGHTDDVPPDGFFYRDNWQLSAARARAVLDAMVAAGIPPSRLAIEALAEFQPLVPNTTDENRTRNRRVDLVVIYPEQSGDPASGTTPVDP
jgi:chemotaxis protein MotB